LREGNLSAYAKTIIERINRKKTVRIRRKKPKNKATKGMQVRSGKGCAKRRGTRVKAQGRKRKRREKKHIEI